MRKRKILSVKNVLRRPLRTFLVICGIGVGIGSIVAFVGIARGFRSSFLDALQKSGATLIVQGASLSDVILSRVAGEQVDTIRDIPGVLEADPSAFHIVPVQGAPYFPIYGRIPGSRLMRKYHLVAGEYFDAEAERVILLGEKGASFLQKTVGDMLTLGASGEYEIIGIYRSGVVFEDFGALAPLPVVQEMAAMKDQYHVVFVYADHPARHKELKEEIELKCPNLTASTPSEFVESYGNQLELAEQFSWAISLIAVVVGGICVLLIMVISVSERVREIGMLKALGWSRTMIVRMILMEGALITITGGLLGLGMGVAGAEFVSTHVIEYGWFNPEYSIQLFGEAMGISIVIGLLGATYPALRASALSPIEALRYE